MKYIFQNIIMHGDGNLEKLMEKFDPKIKFWKDLKNQKNGHQQFN